MIQGQELQIRHQGLNFDGRDTHSSKYVQGIRITVIAFCHRLAGHMDGYERRELARMGYPVSWWDPRSFVALRIKVFVDIFSGSRSPLTKAMLELNIASLEPLDFHVRQSGQAGNLLDDGVFDFLLRLAWAGAIALSIPGPAMQLTRRSQASERGSARGQNTFKNPRGAGSHRQTKEGVRGEQTPA